MAVLLAPQDSVNMAQAQWQEMFNGLFSNGVMAGQLNTYTTTVTSGLSVSIASGRAMIQGFLARSDAAVVLTCATADPTNPRIDRAVLHADLSAHTLTVQLLTGTPAPSPSPPVLTQTGTVWEISLYQIRVNALQTTLSSGSLTDERAYSLANITTGAITDGMMANQKVNRSGDTMTGTLASSAATVLSSSATNAGMEHGSISSPGSPYIDFHSSGNNIDYDFRIQATGGTGSVGQGTLNLTGSTVSVTGANLASGTGTLQLLGQQSGGASGVLLTGWTGGAAVACFSVNGRFGSANNWIDATNNLSLLGGVATLGGQASAGSFGVPVVVAQALDVHVTVTTLQNILTFTPAATGLYQVNMHVSNGNSVGSAINASAKYTDPHLGTPTTYMIVTSLGGAITQLNGGTSIAAGTSLAGMVPAIWASTSAITVQYQSPSGTPNDFITAVIVRLA